MKNSYSSGLISGLFLLLILCAGSAMYPLKTRAALPDGTVVRGERPPINIATVPDEAMEQGIIRIKFNRTVESLLDNGMISSNPDGSVRFGIAGIDQLNQQFGVSEVKKTFDAALQNTKYTERHRLWDFHLWYDLIVPAGTDIRSMVMAYSAKSEIQSSEPVYKIERFGSDMNTIGSPVVLSGGTNLSYTPNDPRYYQQWHYDNTGQLSGTADADIDLPEAWDITRGSSNVVVAIIDGGIDYNHMDLAANMWPGIGYNFITNTPVVTAENHGTHVAGTVAANTNNSVGVSGVAGGDGSGNGVRLMSCQVFSNSGNGGFENAPVWAADNGAAISQNSWGYTSPGVFSQAVLDAIDYFNLNGGGTVLNGGITIFCAMNENSSAGYYPAYYSNTLAVASTNNNDQKSYYSNYGSWIDISAPGGELHQVTERGVLSTLPDNSYGFYQGTSMATPHVSGVAALILSLVPGLLTAAELRDILVSTTDNIEALNPGYTGQMGSGRLNAYQALLSAQQYLFPTAAFSASSSLICTGTDATFIDQTIVPVTSWSWSFPGGFPSSYSGQFPPPIHYPAPGFYDVTLTVSDGITTDTETKTAYLEVRDIIVDFTANYTSIIEGGSVQFSTIQDCNSDTWDWSFPGGSPSSFSGQTPPPITYYVAGNYDVSLTVTKAGIPETKTVASYIKVTPASFNIFNGSIYACTGTFFDTGGPAGDYPINQALTLTFYPSSPGAKVELDFTSFSTEAGYDYLRIYNGISASSPIIGSYSGTSGPGTVTATNPDGALTVTFTSDEIFNGPGWSANISCFYPAPVADFTATNLAPAFGEVVTLQDLSTNSPTSWLWDISPSTFNYLNGTGPTSQHPQLQFTAAGSYTITLTATNSGGSNSITKTEYIDVSEAISCVPGYIEGSNDGDFISLVQLEGIVNATGPTPYPFYTDYSNLTANLTKGSSYTITLSAGTYPNGNNISVWIDYNQDNIFDPAEKLGNVSLYAAPETGTISFVVPFNAATGTTRMRVREVYGYSDFDPCATYYYGETEDYRVHISAVSYCEPSYTLGSNYGDYISLVQLQEINNTTGPAPAPYYTYYDSQTAYLSAGAEYTLTLSAGTYPNSNNMIAWIDYDFDGIFEEEEKLGFVSLLAQPDVGTMTFTVPTAALNGTTRMRVREVYASLEFGPCNEEYYGETEDYPVNISNSGKSLQLNVLLEGLYAGSGTMNQANNESGPQFIPGIADQITVELHNAGNYGIIEYSDPDVLLNTSGSAQVTIPAGFTGSYYVTVKHRNSIETTSASPVSFAAPLINVAFDQPANVYGGNLLMMIDGNHVIFGGDTNLDGGIDTGDMTPVDNDAAGFVSGYLPTDVNGDGVVDTGDMTIVDNNAASFTGKVTP
ncbi:MAG: S8 family serine peptidase [Bacteroidales bacterium]|nr:S8 family serine peptidase [Bacteroidales bacterium]